MDQVRVALRFLAKHHFWFLSGLVVLVTVPLWWMGTSAIAKDYETNKSSIEGAYSKVNGIAGDNPNGTFKEAVDKEHEKLKRATQQAWQQQYAQQAPLFVWPDLPGNFRQRVSALPQTADIPIDLRGVYQNNIVDHVPLIWERCRVRRAKPLPPEAAGAAQPDAPPRGPMPPGPAADKPQDLMSGVVIWSGRHALESQALGFKSRRPSTPEIRFFQEDLWIHEVLLRIIDSVNAQSTEPYNARIKEIKDLRIGQQVAPPVVQSAAPQEEGEDGGVAMPGGGVGGGGKGGFGGGGSEGESEAPTDPTAILENNRYVDKTGAPQASGSADAHSSGVFKLIPAEMTLTMEEAAVPQLLAACANSPIPVEVRKVTIRSQGGAAMAAAGGGGGGERGFRRPGGGGGGDLAPAIPGVPGGGKGGGGGFRGGKGGGGGEEEPGGLPADERRAGPGFQPFGGGQQLGAAEEKAEVAPTDVDVYLRVHVYIFNPPDPTKLNITEGGEGDSGGDEAPTSEAPAEPSEAPPAEAPTNTEPDDTTGDATPPAEPMGDEAAPTETPPAEAPAAEPAPGDAPPAEGGEAPPGDAPPMGEPAPAEGAPPMGEPPAPAPTP